MSDDTTSIADLSCFGQLARRISRMTTAQQKQLLQLVDEKFTSRPRKHDRKAYFMTVDYVVEDKYYRDFIQDMSGSGVFIKTHQRFRVGQIVQMTFMAPDQQTPFKISGKIARALDDGIGVEFVKDSPVQEETITALVKSIRPPADSR